MNSQADLALLRRFEPVVRYTQGEQFFPLDVDPYVRRCSLWVHRPNQLPLQLVPQGELTLEKLAEPRAHGFAAVYYLQFIEPLNLTEMAAYRLREEWVGEPATQFHAGRGRLARVGYASRLVDALFSLSLLARGRVPGDAAVAAALAYQQIMAEQERYCYYGRVVRQHGWIALQYWFFYPFNDWRTGFFGANDHEADWEMIYVYLYEAPDGRLCPEWVAYASHDLFGDDLRRRWDDPELEKVGEHPVIYAGAGSHASYFQRGEYLTELQLPFARPLVRFIDRTQAVWEALRPWDQPRNRKWSDIEILRVPFVDYARGDGVSIGPGQVKHWTPHLLQPTPPWAANYRGLWGLYVQDPFAGENAPAGPLYNRNGTVRRSWYDPLGWSGLDKIPPPPQRLARVQARQAALAAERVKLTARIEALSMEARGLGVELAAIQGQPHLRQLRDEHQRRLVAVSAELADTRAHLTADDALAEALGHYAARIQAGERSPVRAHLRRGTHQPTSDERLRLHRFAETWAAVSIGLVMISFVILVLFAREYLLFGLVTLLAVILFIEASVRRSLTRLINSITVALAIVASFVLMFRFFWDIIIFSVLLAGSYILWENIRELRG